MKKDDIYKLIEYNGVYNDKVKKNLKKIIKQYHPDKNKKDKKTIEIIYEVKKELENDSVSYNPKKNFLKKKQDFISEEECLRNFTKLTRDESNCTKELKDLYNELSKLFKQYSNSYRKFCLLQNQFCELEDQMDKFKKVYFARNIVYLGLIIFLIINSIYCNLNNIIIVLSVGIFFTIWAFWFNKSVNIIKDKMKKIASNIDKDSKVINVIQNKIKKVSDNIHEVERKNTSIKNDIRFYKNMKNS